MYAACFGLYLGSHQGCQHKNRTKVNTTGKEESQLDVTITV